MSSPVVPALDLPVRARRLVVGSSVYFGLVVAFFSAITQIALRRDLLPGEFGTANTIFGLVMVLAAPLLALDLVLGRRDLSRWDESAQLQSVRPVIMETAGFAWGILCFLVLIVVLPFLDLPRTSLHFFAFLTMGAVLLSVWSYSLCATSARVRFFALLCFAAVALRLLVTIFLGHYQPWAQSGLGALIAAGIITAIPALQPQVNTTTRAQAWAILRDGKHLVPFLATISVIFAIALFSNADRIVAQAGFGTPNAAQMGYVDWARFDDYHAAGLLARSLLWITLPLLFLFFKNRRPLNRTTVASLGGFWIYLGALVGGDILLVLLAPYLSLIFTGNPDSAARFIPGFAGAIFMLGLLQGIGVFALASRRYPECFLLAACSLIYTLGLYRYGIQPQLMTSCMFGGALISLMAVLLVGVSRYARNHP